MNDNHEPPSGPGYERRDIHPRAIALLGLALVVSLLLSTGATLLLYRAFSLRTQDVEGPLTVPMPREVQSFPNPQLQIYPPEDLEKLRAQEAAILDGYRWIDRKTGVVGIPISQAMNWVVKEHAEPVMGAPGLPQGPTWTEMMQRRAQQETAAPKQP